jgi:hypothetical protein
MVSYQHYDELVAILARLDLVLPGQTGKERPKGSTDWSWRNTVIEAKPVSLERLVLDMDERWRFRGDIPSVHQTGPSRRWYIREKTELLTEVAPTPPAGMPVDNLPPGVSLWHASDHARRLFVLAKYESNSLFSAQTDASALPADDDWRAKGYITLFATPGPAEYCFRDCARILQKEAPYLTRLVQEYARAIAWMYGMEWHEFEEMCRLHITWRSASAVMPMRLLPASPCRYENGPVVHIGLGRTVITHDLAPTITDPCIGCSELPVRLVVPEGAMMCMDGPSRMRYSHGCPSQRGDSAPPWIMLSFFLDCTRQSIAIGYERETRAVVMATPLCKDRVVAPLQTDLLPCGLALDLTGVLVKNMRLRLRVAESHVLAARHEARVVSSGSTMKSSSSISLE